MKILIGVCGIGKGHCIRQYEISKELILRGHEVRILTYNSGIDFFKDTKIQIYNVYVPMILFKGEKINWKDCIKRNLFKFIPGIINNKRIFRKLMKEKFVPDLCISDYEPTVARIAYKLGVPLINIDQQSKFMYMKQESIDGYSCVEEKKRLQLFFPKFDKKYVVSFYSLPKDILPTNVKTIYPIIRDDLKKVYKYNENNKRIIVYFSKYINISIKQKMDELIEIFNKFKSYKFIIFSTEDLEMNYDKTKNVTILKNDRDKFVKELKNACAVISTAGHTLISEALYCNIPVFAIPLPTFDQHYCGKFLNENKIGYSDDVITCENLQEFLNNEKKYKENIKKCKKLVQPDDTINYLIKEIEKYEKTK